LLAALEQLGRIPKQPRSADVFIALFDPTGINDYFRLASIVRAAGWSAEVFPESKKLAQQLKYADQRGFRVALIAGSEELAKGTVQIKDLMNKISTEVEWREDPERLSQALRTMMRLGEDTLLA
jgi:histidyl-tRNA synthetase